MPLVSRKGILAIAAVIDVAVNARARPVSAKALAARHKLPPRHLEPVLQALVRDGIVRGMRGPHGGYELARAHRSISVEDILRDQHRRGVRAAGLAAVAAGQRRGETGAGRSRALVRLRSRPHQRRGHGGAGVGVEIIASPRAFASPVHDLDSYGRSPRGGKVP
jgi:Rrf2 family protein